MIQIILALFAFLAGQDPDRSTPEKAFTSFTTFWEEVSQEGASWITLQAEIEKIGDFCRTEGRKAKILKSQEEFRQLIDESRTLASKYSIDSTATEKDGSVIVNGKNQVKRRRKNFETKKVEDVDETLPVSVVFEKSGANWLVRELWRSCYSCTGTGHCSACKGTGKAFDQKCYSCDGKKSCKTCSGSGLFKEELAEMKFDLLIADKEPTYSTDLSTPKAAAQTFVDSQVHQTLEYGKKTREFIDRVFAKLKAYLAPSVAKRIEESLAAAIDSGKKRFDTSKPKIESVEEKGDTAYVVIVLPAGSGEQKERKKRALLKKAGDKWLVDAEQDPCWGCQGSGQCGTCKGTGKFGESKCFSCDGSKGCKSCAGSGWGKD